MYFVEDKEMKYTGEILEMSLSVVVTEGTLASWSVVSKALAGLALLPLSLCLAESC